MGLEIEKPARTAEAEAALEALAQFANLKSTARLCLLPEVALVQLHQLQQRARDEGVGSDVESSGGEVDDEDESPSNSSKLRLLPTTTRAGAATTNTTTTASPSQDDRRSRKMNTRKKTSPKKRQEDPCRSIKSMLRYILRRWEADFVTWSTRHVFAAGFRKNTATEKARLDLLETQETLSQRRKQEEYRKHERQLGEQIKDALDSALAAYRHYSFFRNTLDVYAVKSEDDEGEQVGDSTMINQEQGEANNEGEGEQEVLELQEHEDFLEEEDYMDNMQVCEDEDERQRPPVFPPLRYQSPDQRQGVVTGMEIDSSDANVKDQVVDLSPDEYPAISDAVRSQLPRTGAVATAVEGKLQLNSGQAVEQKSSKMGRKKATTSPNKKPPTKPPTRTPSPTKINASPMKRSPPSSGAAERNYCAICAESDLSLDEMGITPCAHVFCMVCLSQMVEQNQKCAICRHPLNEQDILSLRDEVDQLTQRTSADHGGLFPGSVLAENERERAQILMDHKRISIYGNAGRQRFSYQFLARERLLQGLVESAGARQEHKAGNRLRARMFLSENERKFSGTAALKSRRDEMRAAIEAGENFLSAKMKSEVDLEQGDGNEQDEHQHRAKKQKLMPNECNNGGASSSTLLGTGDKEFVDRGLRNVRGGHQSQHQLHARGNPRDLLSQLDADDDLTSCTVVVEQQETTTWNGGTKINVVSSGGPSAASGNMPKPNASSTARFGPPRPLAKLPPAAANIAQQHGSKMEKLAELLVKIKTEDPEAKILVYSQWESLKRKIALALRCLSTGSTTTSASARSTGGGSANHANVVNKPCTAATSSTSSTTKRVPGIHSVAFGGGVNRKARILRQFADVEPGKRSADVLILSLEIAASGLNLLLANHVVFVHPLSLPSLSEVRAVEAQAIGRVRRPGQAREAVHAWRLASLDPIEGELVRERVKIN
ncbi:unnamed protein product [Amoebophrya sp. A25]|nr:unnamed protein product [Amoebophrya sp. A25]|eukprot:GSA25T00026347001.1